MIKHPYQKVMNFRHLFGCDTIANVLEKKNNDAFGLDARGLLEYSSEVLIKV